MLAGVKLGENCDKVPKFSCDSVLCARGRGGGGVQTLGLLVPPGRTHTHVQVITACKIFTRIDRQRSTTLATVWINLDCLFGSALGAADRGADPLVFYYWAIYRVFVFTRSITKSHIQSTIKFVACTAWISRDLGRLGLPTFSRFITKESQQPRQPYCTLIVVVRMTPFRNLSP